MQLYTGGVLVLNGNSLKTFTGNIDASDFAQSITQVKTRASLPKDYGAQARVTGDYFLQELLYGVGVSRRFR